MLDTVSDYAALFNAALAVAILAVLANLSKMHSDILKERLAQAREQSEWKEQRSEAEKADLRADNEKLRVRLEEALSDREITLNSLAAGATIGTGGLSGDDVVQNLASQLERQRADDPSPRPEIDLELAKAEMAQGNWRAAAKLFDRYVALNPHSFEVQFARGVAWANAREDDPSALRAYNEAIALAPASLSASERARAFTYRGAMLKRLGRLEEANSDFLLALKFLQQDPSEYELDDLYYNLAAVAALKSDKATMMQYLEKITDVGYAYTVDSHREDYFSRFREDEDLQNWLDSRRPRPGPKPGR